ncbi:MAG: hypothetical protein WC360_05510 [Opitutales bacterium]|jgi:flagellin-like hook-associated protein FlgL
MRISDVSSAFTLTNQLQNIKGQQTRLQEQLLSGKSVNRLEDNPSVANSVLGSQAAREKLVQMNDNSKLANNISQAGIDALDHVREVNKLAMSIAESEDTAGYVASASNLDTLIQDVLATANTKYGDDYLFAGTASGSLTPPFSFDEESGQYVYNGSGDGRSFEVSGGVSLSPFASSGDNQAILDTLNSLVSLRDAMSAGDVDAIAAATDSLQTADDAILDTSSDLGMVQYRLEILDNRNAAKYSVYDNAEENATNADENETTVALLASQNAYSAALQSSSMILQTSILDYI